MIPRTVRTRVTVVAGLALTVALTTGLLALYLVQRGSARQTTQNELRTYAAQIQQSAAGGAFPRPLPASSLDPSAQAQVLAQDGTVIAATRSLAGLPALYELGPRSATPVRQRTADGALSGEVSVYSEHATVGGQVATIVTMTATSQLSQVNETFARLLGIGVPGILIIACATVWLVTGRALRPVERIRRAVTDISHTDLSQRVPEPGTDDEIGRLAGTMNDMLARLDDASARQRRFVADASHELRSPLTAIRTSLEVGLSHPDQAPWSDIACRAVRQSERLEQLIAQLLALAKADAGQLAARRQPLDLAALLNDLCASDRIAASVPAGTMVRGNPDDLARLFRNLIDNAVRYSRTRVHVSARNTVAGVVIEITDDGPGIPEAERERVFDRFVRLDSSREQASGSAGLGLAIAREIATAHGASIVLEPGPSQTGTRAVVTFPAAG